MQVLLVGVGRLGAFHAATLHAHPAVDELIVAGAGAARAAAVAAELGSGVWAAGAIDEAFDSEIDAVVIASATASHAELVARAIRARLPVFCEKPLALDLAETVAVLDQVEDAGTILQMGFQRRFDPGYLAAREAVRNGRIGRLHTIRTATTDRAPPSAEYVALSGGLYRDALIHDFDAIRWITGSEIVEVYAMGSNGGADYFAEAGDVDTAVAVATCDDGTLAAVTATRYNGAGHDVRMELAGSRDQIGVGLDARTPITSVEPGVPGPPDPWQGFLQRFEVSYKAEIDAFLRVVAGEIGNPCDGREALTALLVSEACEVSRAQRRPVEPAEIAEEFLGAAHRGARDLPTSQRTSHRIS
ncbi:Gfo/Idh/MocA family oxidoreductase [Nocardia sp. CNY236]|uniref:Gfo/Idh/MocA family protein n=1 Tax=Nocardia sp. CNY236 TaxID=1169152 RepID=UPI0003FAFE25|nr:Gfo/Idh/MocA family oxidoreductase [Nocardia sp. CNY236]